MVFCFFCDGVPLYKKNEAKQLNDFLVRIVRAYFKPSLHLGGQDLKIVGPTELVVRRRRVLHLRAHKLFLLLYKYICV
jgi:hypothetical protein